MPRITSGALLALVAILLLPVCASPAEVAADKLVPETTRGFFSIANWKQMSDAWSKTLLGQLVSDPAMKPFVDDIRHQLDERFTGIRLGLTLDDLGTIAGGEIAVAAIQAAPTKAATLLLVDATGKKAELDALLKRVDESLTKQGAKRRQAQAGDATVAVYDLPAPAGRPADAGGQAMYFVRGNLLAVSNDLDVLRTVLARTAGQPGRSLSELPAYQAVMKRCLDDAGTAPVHVRWWIQPVGYIELAQIARQERGEQKLPGRTLLDAFRKHGFEGIQGVGGLVEFNTEKFQILHRTAVFAPQPRQGSLKMLSFLNQSPEPPPAWVPRDVASYVSLNVDVLNVFDNFGPLFDELYNKGKPGLWAGILNDMKNDESGPRVDLRKDLAARLGPRIGVLTDYRTPIAPTSERLLFALETKDERGVAIALAKLFKNDETMRKRELTVGEVKYEIWEAVPPEASNVPHVDLSLPSIGGTKSSKPEEAAERAILPNQAMTVALGHLLVSSHIDYLEYILKQGTGKPNVARTMEYQLVEKAMKQFGADARAATAFSRTDATYRPTYELMKQGKMPQSETMFGRVLNTALGQGKKGTFRKQEIEGEKLPEFDYVRRYLRPAGTMVLNEEHGWFIKGFLLGK